MGKVSKRVKKFQKTGGVQGRLAKGTMTVKGKLKRKSKPSSGGQAAPAARNASTTPSTTRSTDLVDAENLGSMDLESFFEQMNETVLAQGDQEDADEQDEENEEEENPNEKDEAMKEDDADSDSDSNSDSDDEEDVEKAEARMKEEMAKLEQSNPDFHEFLQEHERGLLEFGNQDEDDEEDGDMAEIEDGDDTEAKQEKQQQSRVELTSKSLAVLVNGAIQKHGVKYLKRLVTGAYRSACHMVDSSGKNADSGGYVIHDAKVFDSLLVTCLQQCHLEFAFHLLDDDDDKESKEESDDDKEGDKDEEPLNPKTLEKSKRWKTLEPIMLSFFRSTLHVMNEAKEPELLSFMLKSLKKYMRFLTPFPRIADSILKTLVSLWSAPLDTQQDYQVVRLQAFLRIRQLAVTQPFPFVEDCLKKTYLAYAKRSKFGGTATSSLATLTFMGNCLVELYSLDYHSSYQHAFVYIRQLALLLRAAIVKKTAEAQQQVYCWQFVSCAKLWVAVLSSAALQEDGAQMRSLIYPLTEVLLGMARHMPAPVRHTPLLFQTVRLLQQLAAASELYIPTSSLLLDCLDYKEWTLAPKKTKAPKNGNAQRGLQQFQLIYLLKLPKEDTLRTHEQLEATMTEFFQLLNREVELYRYSAGFPEYSLRIVQRLKTFCKTSCRNRRWHAFAKATLETCQRYSATAVQRRAQLTEAPMTVARLECLRQVEEAGMGARHEASLEKEKKMLETMNAAPTTAKKPKEQEETIESADAVVQKRKKRKATKPSAMSDAETRASLDPTVLEQQDEVQEGIDWLEEDEE